MFREEKVKFEKEKLEHNGLEGILFMMNLTNVEREFIVKNKEIDTEMVCFRFPNGLREKEEFNNNLQSVSPVNEKEILV